MDFNSNAKLIVAAVAVIAICAVLVSVDYSDPADDDVFIVHTGDTDANTDGTLCFDNVAKLRDDLSAKGPVFLFDTGDCLQGTGMTMLTKGNSSVEIMNAVGYDAVSPGYHDFTYGIDIYLDRADDFTFPVVCANMVFAGTGEPILEEYVVIEKQGLRLGVFGMMSPYIEDLERPDFLNQVKIQDPIATAERMVDVLQKKDVDLIVALGHFGKEADPKQTAQYICEKVKGIDIFIDGNNDGPGSVSENVGDSIVVNTAPEFGEIGVLSIGDRTRSAKLSSYSGSDDKVSDVIRNQQDRTDAQLLKVVGHTQVEIFGGDRQSFFGENEMGDLGADAIRYATKADVALINGGFVRGSFEPGDITVGDVCKAFPFDNSTITKKVTGKMLTDILEQGFSMYPEQNGGFPQMSGMTVTWDPDAQPYHRVVSVMVGDAPLDPERTYTLAGSDYMLSGGDGYTLLKDVPMIQGYGLVYENVCSYLLSVGDIKEAPQGRLTSI